LNFIKTEDCMIISNNLDFVRTEGDLSKSEIMFS
jgi:hypothetical protein